MIEIIKKIIYKKWIIQYIWYENKFNIYILNAYIGNTLFTWRFYFLFNNNEDNSNFFCITVQSHYV